MRAGVDALAAGVLEPPPCAAFVPRNLGALDCWLPCPFVEEVVLEPIGEGGALALLEAGGTLDLVVVVPLDEPAVGALKLLWVGARKLLAWPTDALVPRVLGQLVRTSCAMLAEGSQAGLLEPPMELI